MSWGATAFTPIVTYNQPPFGFHEIITPTDYKRCNEDPYIGTEQLKEELNERFHLLEKLRKQRRQRELAEMCATSTVGVEGVEGVEGFGHSRHHSMLRKLLILVVIAYIIVKMTQ